MPSTIKTLKLDVEFPSQSGNWICTIWCDMQVIDESIFQGVDDWKRSVIYDSKNMTITLTEYNTTITGQVVNVTDSYISAHDMQQWYLIARDARCESSRVWRQYSMKYDNYHV